ncbi:hypothetical protein OUZ56_010128 [Daphnia magna]|uniref:Uncharacterized protein n=1 Tax=Daphnia magna TaxID=35525 RepID=A0ABR0AHW3_9CRUS|nr:hypothetical protein OUZ56_010128 [Daphnia magna]
MNRLVQGRCMRQKAWLLIHVGCTNNYEYDDDCDFNEEDSFSSEEDSSSSEEDSSSSEEDSSSSEEEN